jgi:hypothetical protein
MKGLALCLGAALVLATSIVSHADDSTDLAVAGSWLTAAARDNAALESATAFPFTFRTTNKIKGCERTVRDASAFSKWAACFRKRQKLLLGEVKAGANLREASAQDVESKALRAVADKIPGDGRWLRAFINGDGVTFTLLFKVTGGDGAGKVTAMVLEAEVENE